MLHVFSSEFHAFFPKEVKFLDLSNAHIIILLFFG